eukprot:TRINITY_DN7989_c0_g1_i1.p1 TRINITY_DN7989_c0_g1~~TRINITY_DN7989_c0_g1_i1.p1  ORF type:complete len:321 (-),score=49.96 TRINITY_DN7989_c0_g1_i1:99-1061(-)
MISPPDLHTRLCQGDRKLLILDVRSPEKFDRSRIYTSLHIDATGINLNSEFPKISDIPSNIFRNMVAHRSVYDIVIVDDDGSDSLGILKHQLFRSKPLLLVGGFQMYNALYSSLCEGDSSFDSFLAAKIDKELKKNQPLKVTDNVFIGDLASAENFRALDLLGIEYMVNVNKETPCPYKQEYIYISLHLEELPFEDLSNYFDRKVISFIDKGEENNKNTLIYSEPTINNAGMCVCAYLMFKRAICLEEAYLTLSNITRAFSPNMVVLNRLLDYEDYLIKKGILSSEVRLNIKFVNEEIQFLRNKQKDALSNSIMEEEDLC